MQTKSTQPTVSVLEDTSEPQRAEAPCLVIGPRKSWLDLDLRSIYVYRELLYFLVWRDVKVRYKQASIGATWAILQPVLTMLVFTIIFGKFAKMPSDGLPYPIFAYTALLPWNYFAQAISQSGSSVVRNSNLISKVYFPRLIMPIASTLTPLVDFAIAFIILVGMMVWYGITPTWGVLALPLFLLLAMLTAVAVCLFLSALNVQYRDVEHAIPFLVQFWMYASPVVYSVHIVPEKWRALYSLNPMVGVMEGFRWALLGRVHPDFVVMIVSAAAVVLLLFGGLIYFRRMERTFADVI
ncbi:MAG TPA: ABC transporter permease [Verrucomicrobiae bacterium]|nr:ABC transporter permease [Verrucomicrobiae bacterium]